MTRQAEDRGPPHESPIPEARMLRKMAGVWKTPPAGIEEQAVAFLSSNQPKLEPHFFLQLLVNPEAGEDAI